MYGYFGGSLLTYIIQSVLHVRPFFERAEETLELLRYESNALHVLESQRFQQKQEAVQEIQRNLFNVIRKLESNDYSSNKRTRHKDDKSRVVELD